MSVDRSLWHAEFSRDAIPRFPCPSCTGRLLADKGSLFIGETAHSIKQRDHDDWEPDWIDQRFSIRLVCPDPDCGEIVLVSGDTIMTETYDDEFPDGCCYEDALRPRAVFPAPPIINIPAASPNDVSHNVKLSFSLFWADKAAAANRLRVAVEYLLDDLKVSRTVIKNKKTLELSLNNRIEAFGKREPTHTQTLHALRIVGNLGSHGSIKVGDLLDGYELMENLLDELVNHRSTYLAGLSLNIISRRSKRSR
ncbi:hypothetical protein MSKU15_1940 [Komagataeibacter diospyri]|uniref:DUF4145 domain-containing protein n=1 Tax=Komagataeibacter diospyri TaxID=1932662 RepID=UPI00113C8327|nr:DUF4145 domain-containing protein [Komagataeibacter diospyri]GCE90339.1 hypothetical protein MSKU15_1940 [Komagataeibacter diospyri]